MFIELSNQCQQCANKQFFDNDYRCARYHDSLCKSVYKFCNGKYFLHINDGISLYAMKSWLNRLSSEELELPLLFSVRNHTLVPFSCTMCYNRLYKNHWRFHAKRDEKNDK